VVIGEQRLPQPARQFTGAALGLPRQCPFCGDATTQGTRTRALILAGTAIALPCIWALGRLVESQLFSVKPTDPVTIGAAALLLAGAALGAALVPAYRASTVNPTDALRFE
jgi:hypothetical protein